MREKCSGFNNNNNNNTLWYNTYISYKEQLRVLDNNKY